MTRAVRGPTSSANPLQRQPGPRHRQGFRQGRSPQPEALHARESRFVCPLRNIGGHICPTKTRHRSTARKEHMRTHLLALVGLVFATLPTFAASAPATEPSNLGPIVVKMEPQTLANDVDPGLTAIKVTFDQPMVDKNWSWVGGGDTFPKTAGDISYDVTHTTCTLPVKLEPGKAYWVGINSPSNQNFKSATGKPAQRYVIC